MNLHHHSNGQYTCVSEKGDVLSEGNLLEAILDCGEMAEIKDLEDLK